MKETGIALLLSSTVLGLFLFIPLSPQPEQAAAVTTPVKSGAYGDVAIAGKAAVVYDLLTDEILYEKNADAQLPLASLTKVLTVYAATRMFEPSTPITVSQEAAAVEAPRALSAGDTLAFSDIARLTLTGSLNDGAAAIAQAVSAAAKKSTDAALASATSALGLSTIFAVNGNGLDENESFAGGYGSARDIAILAGTLAREAPDIAGATTEQSATAVSKSGKRFTVQNTNPTVIHTTRLLFSKTGFTDLAGGNLAVVFDAGVNHPVAVVVLGSTQTERFTDVQALISSTLAHFAGLSAIE